MTTSAAAQQPECPSGAMCETVEVAPAVAQETNEDAPAEAEEAPVEQETEHEAEAAVPSPDPEPLASEQPDWRPPGVADSTLLQAGTTTFVIGYAIPLIVGLVAAEMADQGRDGAVPFIPMLVPVAGPLITGAMLDDVPGPIWALLGATSTLQATGLILMVVGATQKRGDDGKQARRWQPTADGFAVRF